MHSEGNHQQKNNLLNERKVFANDMTDKRLISKINSSCNSTLKTQVINVGNNVEKREPSYAVDRNVSCAATVKNSMEVSYYAKNKTTT